MSRRCQITNKGTHRGNNVSHANNKRRKVWNANIHTKRIFDTKSGKWVKVKLSARALRTVNKKGLAATLKDAGLSVEDFA